MIRWRVLHIAVLYVFRDLVRRCAAFRFGGVVGRVRSARIDVVRLSFCSCFALLSIHFYHVVAFVESILVLLLLVLRELYITWGCLWRSVPHFVFVWFPPGAHGEVGLECIFPSSFIWRSGARSFLGFELVALAHFD